MRFHRFIKEVDGHDDPEVRAFQNWLETWTIPFPQSSDPALLGLYLEGRLSEQQR